MNSQQIKQYWQDNGETLYTYSFSNLDKTKVDKGTIFFLTTCGLPSDAAPFLSFSQIRENQLLTPNQIFKIDFEGLDNYLMFGINGSGDPICIDTIKHNQIVYLNHDNYFERIFINSSILQFAACLIKYRDFIISLFEKASKDYSRRKFSNAEFEQFKNILREIDSIALTNKSFWSAELDSLLSERDYE